MSLFARLKAWFVSSVVAPELLPSKAIEVDVVLDEDDLFHEPMHSGVRMKIVEPSELLFEEEEGEITRRIDVSELLEEERAASGGRR